MFNVIIYWITLYLHDSVLYLMIGWLDIDIFITVACECIFDIFSNIFFLQRTQIYKINCHVLRQRNVYLLHICVCSFDCNCVVKDCITSINLLISIKSCLFSTVTLPLLLASSIILNSTTQFSFLNHMPTKVKIHRNAIFCCILSRSVITTFKAFVFFQEISGINTNVLK